MKKITKKDILKFLEDHQCASLSSISPKGFPNSAIVYYGIDKKFNIFVAISTESRKFRNISKNNNVAMAFSSLVKEITVQMEGAAQEITRVKPNKNAVKILTKALKPTITQTIAHIWDPIPPILKMACCEIVLLKISPKWIRWADFSQPPSKTRGKYFTEFKFK